MALMFSQTGTDVLPRRDEGSDLPSATIEPHRIMVPTRDSNPGGRIESPMSLPLYYRGTHDNGYDYELCCSKNSDHWGGTLGNLNFI